MTADDVWLNISAFAVQAEHLEPSEFQLFCFSDQVQTCAGFWIALDYSIFKINQNEIQLQWWSPSYAVVTLRLIARSSVQFPVLTSARVFTAVSRCCSKCLATGQNCNSIVSLRLHQIRSYCGANYRLSAPHTGPTLFSGSSAVNCETHRTPWEPVWHLRPHLCSFQLDTVHVCLEYFC